MLQVGVTAVQEEDKEYAPSGSNSSARRRQRIIF
jgi:hypothetical protein